MYKSKQTAITRTALKLIIILLLSFTSTFVYALDYPHNGDNNIGCDSCHFVYGSEQSLLPSWTAHAAQDIDDTQFNTLCWGCHNDIQAPFVRTHSSLNTSAKYGDADNDTVAGWSMECRTCHNPHTQLQLRTYTSASFIEQGTVGAVTTTTLTKTGATWAVDQYKDYLLVPNSARTQYNYKITGNTADTLTVKGTINLARVSVGNTFGIVYGKLIKNSLTTPNSGSKTVKFFRNLGANSLSDGDATRDGICEACHTQTTHWRNDGTETIPGHNSGVKCTGCHLHSGGFKGIGCDSCHGYPPVVNTATGGPNGLVFLTATSGTTGSTTAGAHDKHVNTKGFECMICHYGSVGTGSNHNNGVPQDPTIGFYLFNGAYLGGTYDGQAAVNYDSSEANTTATNTGSKTCSNIYCHGTLPNGTDWAGGQDTTPQWDGSVTCSSCHDAGGSSSNLPGKHSLHTDDTTYAFPCEKCHNLTATGSTAIKNESYHANNTKDLSFSAGGTFDSGTKACSSTYCHSDASGGAPNRAIAWTDSTPVDCESCHNGRPGQETQEMTSNGHDKLASSNWVRQYPCHYCHEATVDVNGNIEDYSKHLNETKDVVFASNWNITGNPAPSYNAGTKTCSNIYCHSDGTTVNPQVRQFAWDGGSTKCNTCHGHESGTCSTCHNDGRTAWAAGDEWKAAMPMYSNGGAGTETANTHLRHLLTDFTCDNCHANTISNGACTTCHINSLPTGSMSESSHIDPAYHVNKVKDVAFKDGGTFNNINKTCSNTACHTGGDPQWGDSVNNLVICLTCHGTTGPDIDDFVYQNSTRAKINMTEWADTGHGRPTASGNYVSGNPPANFPGNPCWYCHDNTVIHGTNTNPFRLKLHPQFAKRFDKECVFCHMEINDTECLNCHNAAFSLAPQLADLTDPPLSQDHTGYTDGLTSCVTSCHSDNASIHDTTGNQVWTSTKKDDVKNAYVMMGVCLQCHEDDSNGQCNKCHTGAQYALGYDPGTGLRVATTAKATSVHFGYKHYQAYQADGTWKGGKFCWDCHDAHGDSNIFMMHDTVSTETDGTYGIPTATGDVVFTKKQSGLDYAKSSAPYNGICNVCHTDPGQHYRNDGGDGHNAARICTTCHEHRFSNSHSSGKACDTCHADRPVPRHTAFGLPRDCTKCHSGTIKGRMDIVGQFNSNSHHVQGVTLTNKHCYACHWEATSIGLINTTYHSGYNYKTHVGDTNREVDLVIWGAGVRPTTYTDGTTAVAFDKEKIGTVNERAEVAKVSQVCLGCHSDQNNETQPFNLVDPDNGDCKTPNQYAWDGSSVASRYSQAGSTTWGKYTGTANAAKKDITKAFSAHGNATANEGGWSSSTGVDATITNTRNGTENVQCYDCHSSHGSKASGTTSSYKTFNGTQNGANLKETQAGKGGYMVTYKPSANSNMGSVNPYNAGAGLCFDCHETASSGTKPWGYNSTFGATEPIMGYKDTSRFGDGTSGSDVRFPYRSGNAVLGGHMNATSPLGNTPARTIGGLCTPCHDPHGISPTLGSKQQYAVPLLKGTWLTSPYKDDSPLVQKGSRGYRNPAITWWTDRRTFGGGRITQDQTLFAGLCLSCHQKGDLTDGIDKNTAFQTRDRIHESVKGWGNNAEHDWPCAKCHQPHSSGLPRLMQTNCLDSNHQGNRASGGTYGSYGAKRFPRSYNTSWACHESSGANNGSWTNQRWNTVTPW